MQDHLIRWILAYLQRTVLAGGALLAVAVWLVPDAALAQDAARGQALFEQLDCSRCHGVRAGGSFGPQLAATELSLLRVTAQVRDPIGMMPSFATERLGDDDIADIYAWLQSLADEPAYPTWFATDLINLPTPMLPGEKTLEVHFSHRFFRSVRDAGRKGLGGLDSFAFPTFWFAYGITDWLQVHGGRSSLFGTWDYGAKIELLDEERTSLPLSVSAVVSGAYLDSDVPVDKKRFIVELPVGLRVHDRVSVMAVPFLATNTDAIGNPASDSYSAAIGLGGSFRFTPRQSIDVEWISNIGGFKRPDSISMWQVFWGIKVGGHVFQIGLGNTYLQTPDQTSPGYVKGGTKSEVRIGFNLVRAFKFGGG